MWPLRKQHHFTEIVQDTLRLVSFLEVLLAFKSRDSAHERLPVIALRTRQMLCRL